MNPPSVRIILALGALVMTSCEPPASLESAQILLLNGTGVSPNSVKAVEAVLRDRHLSYAVVNSRELNDMPESQLRAYRLMIIPGGNYISIGNSLKPEAVANIRNAVQGGLNYLGICAGGLLAGSTTANGLNLTSGVGFGFYRLVNQGIHKAAVTISQAGGSSQEHYWEDGPEFTGWGAVVGRYPDGTPAIVEGSSGNGWVVLCGVHPEAPENWRRGMNFTTSASRANDYAGMLIEAALHRTALRRD